MNNLTQRFCMTLVLFFTTSILTSATYAEIAIIVNKASPLTAAQASDIQRVYLGKTQKINGTDVTPVNQTKNTGLSDNFNKVVLNKTSNQVKAYWSKLIFTGKGTPPQELNNDVEVINAVRGDVNTIGYIDASLVDDTVNVILTLE